MKAVWEPEVRVPVGCAGPSERPDFPGSHLNCSLSNLEHSAVFRSKFQLSPAHHGHKHPEQETAECEWETTTELLKANFSIACFKQLCLCVYSI